MMNKKRFIVFLFFYFFSTSNYAVDEIGKRKECMLYKNTGHTDFIISIPSKDLSEKNYKQLIDEINATCYMPDEKNLCLDKLECYKCCTGEFDDEIKCKERHKNWRAAQRGKKCDCP